MVNDTQVLSELAAQLGPPHDVTAGKWFGKPCLKVAGRVFAALWTGDMALKLTGEARAEALQVEGARRFDPRGKGQPMKEWVQIPAAQSSTWGRYARLACDYVAGAAQAKKEAIVGGLERARKKILDEVSLLSPPEQDAVFLGQWSVKDLLAHLAGWDYTNLSAVQEILAGQKPGFLAYYDRDWKSYNARLVAEYKRDELAELIAVVEESHQKLIGFLQAVPADEYLRRRRIESLLRVEIRDEEAHHRQVEAFRTHSA